MDSTDDMGKPLPSQGIRLRTGLELQSKGWRLAPGELAEVRSDQHPEILRLAARRC